MKEKMKLKMSLFNLNQNNMREIRGGGDCCCGCLYANSGGSDTADNADANIDGGYRSPKVCAKI